MSHRTPILAVALAIACAATPARAVTPAGSDSAAAAILESLVQAERAFSAMSVAQGMKPAFLEFMAEDGVAFAPGPVNARKTWQARPAPKSTLIWEPAYAEAAAGGDLGVSLGPWELRPPEGAEGSVLHGHFISVWAREGDAPWRVKADLGVTHDKPEHGVGAIEFTPGPLHVLDEEAAKRFGFTVGGAVMGRHLGMGIAVGDYVSPRNREFRSIAHETHRMMSAERTYAFEARRGGADPALNAIAAPDLRVFRNGAPPAFGVVEGAERIGAGPQRVEFVPSGRGVSRSRDIGYSYGIARRWASPGARPDSSAYLHVWRCEPEGDWKLIVDVESEFPKR